MNKKTEILVNILLLALFTCVATVVYYIIDSDFLMMVWLLSSVLIGIAAFNRGSMSFWGAVFTAICLSPITAAIVVFFRKSRRDIEAQQNRDSLLQEQVKLLNRIAGNNDQPQRTS